MTFAAIDNATLLNWHAQAIAAQTMLNSYQVSAPFQPQVVPVVATPLDQAVLQNRPSQQVVGLVAWLHSLETELQDRGLAAPGAAPADGR